MNKDQIWREGSRIVVDHDQNLIHITSVGSFDVEHALRCKKFIFEIFDQSPSYFDLIIDISREGKHGPGARKVWKEINAHAKVRYVALCGVNSFAKVAHSFIIGFRKHPRLRLFTNPEEAAGWLKSTIRSFKSWLDTSKGQLPQNNEEVVLEVKGMHYVAKFDAVKEVFRVDDELIDLTFAARREVILWKPYRKMLGRIENFTI